MIVKRRKHEFIIKLIFDNKVKKVHIINDWCDKIEEDKENQASIIKKIEDQIDSCEKMESKSKVIMKKSCLRYANEVIDINAPMDFFVIMDKLKQEIIFKLIFCEPDRDKTDVDIIYYEKLEGVEFVNKMTTSYNNI